MSVHQGHQGHQAKYGTPQIFLFYRVGIYYNASIQWFNNVSRKMNSKRISARNMHFKLHESDTNEKT